MAELGDELVVEVDIETPAAAAMVVVMDGGMDRVEDRVALATVEEEKAMEVVGTIETAATITKRQLLRHWLRRGLYRKQTNKQTWGF